MAEKIIMIKCNGHNSPLLKCSGMKKSTDFYKSRSQFAYFPSELKGVGLVPYCKECVQKTFDYYYKNGRGLDSAVYYTCQKLDLPFITEVYDKILLDFKTNKTNAEFLNMTKNYMGTYIGILNKSTIEYRDKLDFSYSDADLSQIDIKIESREKEKKDLERFILDWGNQDTDDDYAFLEYRYDVYTDGKTLTPAQESLYRQLCLIELTKRRKERAKESIKEEQDMIIKLMTKLKIDNFDEQKELSIVEKMLETRIAIQEKEKPTYYYDDVKRNADYMGKGRDFYNHIYRPFKNVFQGSKEYKISPIDESKDDEYYYKLMEENSNVDEVK